MATPTASRGARPDGRPLSVSSSSLPAVKISDGVTVNDAADVGEHERAALALKETLAERLFQHLDLRADRRLRQPQLLGGPRDAALPHDRPEVEQVMVVQRIHDASSDEHNKNLTIDSQLSICQWDRSPLPSICWRRSARRTAWKTSVGMIAAVARTVGLVVFLLALGWAAWSAASVHCVTVRQDRRSGSSATGRDPWSAFDDELRLGLDRARLVADADFRERTPTMAAVNG